MRTWELRLLVPLVIRAVLSLAGVLYVPIGQPPPPKPAAASTPLHTPIEWGPLSDRKIHIYPWKKDIITTKFYLEAASRTNRFPTPQINASETGWANPTANADARVNGVLVAKGQPFVGNPFYVALPFDDLAYPDKARRWMPSWWQRPPVDGKPVSACLHRWVEIKNAQGKLCYAQWEDVGPLRRDHAEYVFGQERPTTLSRAGLDVSPGVWEYLGLGKNVTRVTSWRFVDAEDVPPGAWLKFDEQSALYHAILLSQKKADASANSGAKPAADASTNAP